MAWLSPVFPTGGFAYSAGLEQARADGTVRDEAHFKLARHAALTRGSFWNEAVLIAAASRGESVRRLRWRARPLRRAPPRNARSGRSLSRCRRRLGTAWPAARDAPARRAWRGLRAGRHPAGRCAHRRLQTLVSNQLQAAIRLSLIGQTARRACLPRWSRPFWRDRRAARGRSTLDDLGGSRFGRHHERCATRRSNQGSFLS
jgi:urease accessory protein